MTMRQPKASATGRETDLSLVMDSLPQAVIVLSGPEKIIYANAAAESIFGMSSSQIMRGGLKSVVPATSPVFQLVHQILDNGSPVNEYQIDISTPRTGEGRIVDIFGTPMGDAADTVVLVFRERGMADRIARQLSHRSSARSVTGLASMLAHEIKNPLSGIRGASQLLETATSGSDRELVQLIRSETDRVVKLLDRMEVFSDESPVRLEPVNMHSVMGQVRRLAQAGFAKGIAFTENYDPSLPPVSGSRDELVQLFLNLVKNAAEALSGTGKPRIRLSSAYRPGMRVSKPGSRMRAELPLEFSVSDNGPGIAEEIRSDIFDPFVTSRINGSGLGLALVAKTIGRHGGIIECDTSSDGTTFKLLLPAWKDSDSKPDEAWDG